MFQAHAALVVSLDQALGATDYAAAFGQIADMEKWYAELNADASDWGHSDWGQVLQRNIKLN